jgi:hypothetical protein
MQFRLNGKLWSLNIFFDAGNIELKLMSNYLYWKNLYMWKWRTTSSGMKAQIRPFTSCLTTTALHILKLQYFLDVNANKMDPCFLGKVQKKKWRKHHSVYGSRVSKLPSKKKRCL